MDRIVRADEELRAGGLELGRRRQHEIPQAGHVVILQAGDIVGKGMRVQGHLRVSVGTEQT
ncbi:hypothetical protein D3C80_1705200 [compost metagenome]